MRTTTPRGWLVIFAIAVATLAVTLNAASASARAWLGVYTQELTDDLRAGLDLHGDGVLVNQVIENSPAAKAGLRKGDVIVRFNSRTVDSPESLSNLVGDAREGQTIALDISRHGEARSLDVTLGTRPDEGSMSAPEAPEAPEAPAAPAAPGKERHVRVRVEAPDGDSDETPTPPEGKAKREVRVQIVGPDGKSRNHIYHLDGDMGDLQEQLQKLGPQLGQLDLHGLGNLGELGNLGAAGGRARLGVRIESLSDDLASALDAPGHEGVLVMSVMKDTPAERAGLRAGDVILGVNGKGVADAPALQQALRDVDGKVTLKVSRKGSTREVEAELNAAPHSGRMDSDEGPGRVEVFRRESRDRSDADRDDLKKQVEELRQQLRELRHQLEERDR